MIFIAVVCWVDDAAEACESSRMPPPPEEATIVLTRGTEAPLPTALQKLARQNEDLRQLQNFLQFGGHRGHKALGGRVRLSLFEST